MQSTPVIGEPVVSPVMLIGQAPGVKEIDARKPFAWTAGRTLFKWFAGIGLGEQAVRTRIHMAAVCRCFPGKNIGGGDRVPNPDEIENCSGWLAAELDITRPRLIIPIGKLAASRFLDAPRLDLLVGKKHETRFDMFSADLIPLPHPSGASVWHHVEPGKTLLQRALALIKAHPAWREICRGGEG